MRTFDKRLSAQARVARVLVARAPTLTLAFESRRRSRLAAVLDSGEAIGVILPRGTALADGDLLVGSDGALARVVAAAEPVLLVRAPTATALARAAYHLGNRHTPVEIGDGYLLLEDDPVLARMLRGLGMTVEAAMLPFQPEAGAYGGGHRHGHDETFAEDYALAQTLFEEHGHAHGEIHDLPEEHRHAHGDTHGLPEEHGHAHGGTHAHAATGPHGHRHGPDDD